MSEVFSSTCTADSALLTVELLLRSIVVKEIANRAVVVCKLKSTSFAFVRRLLSKLTVEAANKLDAEPVNLMLVLDIYLLVKLGFVMAEPADEELLALFTLD